MGFIEQLDKNLERFEWDKHKQYIHRNLYRELIQIISDMETSEASGVLIFGKQEVSVRKVKEVYSMLESQHLESVCEKYNKIGYPIRNKQTYLRAMLFNEFFEFEATITNDVNVNEGLADV
ncbi:MAG: hypothetical protein IJZ54_06985 [Clostridia bacterium]|nr:hypothetical protein [Clostridia bacterium]